MEEGRQRNVQKLLLHKKKKKEGFLDVSFLCAETSFLCAEINEMGGKSVCKKDVSFKGRFRALWPSKAPTIII